MTVPPPPAVPGELIEKAARALYEATREPSYADPAYDWPNIDTGYDKPDEAITDPEWCRNAYRADAETVIAAVYGDIVEAARRDALTGAMEGNALARAVGWDDGYVQGRRDALTEAAEAIEALAGWFHTPNWNDALNEAGRVLTDLIDGDAPTDLRSAP